MKVTLVSAAASSALPSKVLPSTSTGNPRPELYSRHITSHLCHSEDSGCLNITTNTILKLHTIKPNLYSNLSKSCIINSSAYDIQLPITSDKSLDKEIMDVSANHHNGCFAKNSMIAITCSTPSGSSLLLDQMIPDTNSHRSTICGRTSRHRHTKKYSSTVRAVSCNADPVLVSLLQWIIRYDMSGQEDISIKANGSSPKQVGVEPVLVEHCDEGSVSAKMKCDLIYMPRTRLKRSLCSQRTLRLKAAVFPETGRGLMAQKCIAAGEILVSIPREFMVNSQDVLKNQTLRMAFEQTQKKFTSIEILAVFLLYNKSLQEKSSWIPYINSLPHEFTVFSDVQEAPYYPSFISKLLVSQLKIYKDSCSSIKQVCHCLSLDVTDDEAGWAFMAVNSRTVYLQLEGSCSLLKPEDSGSCALAPYLDLMNHSHKASVNVLLDKSDNCYKIITNVPYKRHQEVFINYGPHDNVSLFVEYGFYLPSNPHDGYPVSVDDLFMMLSCLPLLNKSSHHPLLSKLACSLEESKNMFLARDGPSWSLEAVASILLMPAKDLGSWQVVYGGVRGLPHYPKVRCLLAALIAKTLTELEQQLGKMKMKEHGSEHFKLGCGLVEEYLNLVRNCKVVFEQQS